VAAEKIENNDGEDVQVELEVIDDQDQRTHDARDVATSKQADSELDLNYSLAKRPPYQNLTVDNILLKFGSFYISPPQFSRVYCRSIHLRPIRCL
jgi:hypothetical protein